MITDLRLQHFRSYRDESFEISPGVNIVVGPNASGKTNLLEAVLVLAKGSSYRAKDSELIQFEKDWARIDGHLDSGGTRTIKLVTTPKPTKTYEIDGKSYSRLSLTHSLPVVLFEPNHLQLLIGSPERRRDHLDDLLEQTQPGYGTLRRQYKRTLAQRNRLLKQPGVNNAQLFPWDVRLSQLGGRIIKARSEITDQIHQVVQPLYKELSDSDTQLSLKYASRWPVDNYESKLLSCLSADAELDITRGFTGAGPHREDLEVSFDDHPAADTASRGETRTAVLAMKIAELQLIEAARDQTPLLLLDDVFSELDGKRRHALTDYLANYQTFITTTDADLIIKNFTQKAHIIPTKAQI